jgi:hypothetical protein
MLLIMLGSFACCDSAYQIVGDVLVVQPFLLASSSTSPNSARMTQQSAAGSSDGAIPTHWMRVHHRETTVGYLALHPPPLHLPSHALHL